MANSGLFEIAVIGDAVGRKNWLVAGKRLGSFLTPSIRVPLRASQADSKRANAKE
jgi:hypothetical protein